MKIVRGCSIVVCVAALLWSIRGLVLVNFPSRMIFNGVTHATANAILAAAALLSTTGLYFLLRRRPIA